MAVTLYLARHAEAANPKNILYGRLPRVDLSTSGRDQAGVLAGAMAELRLDAIYHSPLLRARRTANIIAAQLPGVPLRLSSLLLENLHPYQGRPNAEVAKLGDRAYDADVLGTEGETIQHLCDRMARFLKLVARSHPDGIVAAVSHADPLAALRVHLLGLEMTVASMRKEAPPLASVFRVDLKDGSYARLDWFWKPPAPPAEKATTSKNGSSDVPEPVVEQEPDAADNTPVEQVS